MGFMGRTMLGAAGGGLYGASGGGGWMGAAGGAIGGGLVGGMGIRMGSKFLNKRGNIAGSGQRGLNFAAGGIEKLRGLAKNYGHLPGVGSYGVSGVRALDKAAWGSARFLGNNASAVNKYGGYALGAMGAASAAHIGSTVLSSNRGY